MATDDINVFGSLRDFIADQSMQAVERDRAKLEAIRAAQEQFTPTPAQSAYLSAIFAPGSGIVDAAGQFPEFPSSDVALIDAFSGDPMPSIAENIAAGGIDRYLFAPLQAVGVAGDALYAANPFIAGLPKGIATLGAVARAAGKADKKGIKALRAEQIQQDINTFARDSEGFVSPSLEALISKAPPNLQGKQITEWLSANANKGVKPKELEFLGVDEFIANNPNASVREVAEGVSQNKVEVDKNVYYHGGDAPEIDFVIDIPKFDPLDPTRKNYQYLIDDILYDIEKGDDYTTQEVIDFFNQSNPQAGAMTISDVDNYLSARNESLDDLIDNFAKDQYFNDPYELVVPKSTGEIDAGIPDQTFAFGNENVGYNLFIGGERVKVADNEIPYSRTEAQIQLRNALEEGGDPLRLPGEEDLFTETRYKGFVDGSLPGGDNYREIVYTWKNAPYEHDVQDHFNELSQISHALVRDRKLADGSTSLHVDELQSDLHTQGKQAGYELPDKVKIEEIDKIESFLEGTGLTMKPPESLQIDTLVDNVIFVRDGNKFLGSFNLRDLEYLSKYAKEQGRTRYGSDQADAIVKILGKEKVSELADLAKPLADQGTVPNYPFKGDDWYKMSLKQLLKDAIEEGKDTISVSGSAPMIARYSNKYEKFYKSLYDQKIPSAMKTLANKYGGKFEKGKLDYEDTFNPLIGENPDVRLQENFANRYETPENEDMALSDILSETLEPGLEANIIRITPEMKQKILEEGLPSFALGGPVNNFIAPKDINIFA